MKKINQFITLAVLLVLIATRVAGQTYTSGQFKYELNQAGGVTYAYITGLANSSSTVTTITIPGVIEHSDGNSYFTYIAANAFKENMYLTDITVGYGCRAIFNNAFAFCYNLKSLRLPSSITSLWQGIVNGSAQNGLKIYAAMTTIPNTHNGAWMGIPKNKSKFYTFSNEMKELYTLNDEYNNYFNDIWVEDIPHFACDYINTSGSRNCYVVTTPSTKTSDGEMMLIGTWHEAGTSFEAGVGSSNTELMLPDYKVTGHKTYLTKVMDEAYYQAPITKFTSYCSRLKEIGKNAFFESDLQEVHIEGTTDATIDKKAFWKCEDLTTVYVDTKNINDSAFCDCTDLNNLTLAKGVKTIHGHSFRNCDELTELNIPASLTYLESNLRNDISGSFYTWGGFRYMKKLRKITVASGNAYFSAYDNVLYDKNKTKLLFCPRGIDIIPTFPTTLKEIGYSAFFAIENRNWTKLEIPYGVTTLEKYSIDTPYFKYIKLPSTATMVDPEKTIIFISDENSNHNVTLCLGKASFTFNEGDVLFFIYNPGNLYVPAGDHLLSTISGHAALNRLFKNYYDGDQYYDDDEINITYGAYDVLTNAGIPLLLDEQTKTAKVVYGRFDQDYTAQLSGFINIPETYTYRGTTYTITAIDMHAFEGNKNITGVTIPKTVTSFPGATNTQYEGAEEDGCQFKGCTNLESVIFRTCSFTSIPNNCFYNNRLVEMYLPYGVTDIGYQAFAYNNRLLYLLVPSSVKARGSVDKTFIKGCAIRELYFNTTPDVVQFSGAGFFTNLSANSKLYVPVGQCSAFRNVTGWQFFSTIKSGANDLQTADFLNPYTVLSLGNGDTPGEVKRVFGEYSNDTGTFNNSQTISDGWGRQFTVVELGDSCLAGKRYNSVNIPQTIRRIGSQAMKGMSNLQSVTTQMTTLPELGDNVWEGVNQANVQLFFPEGMYEAYSTAPQWKNFFIQEPLTIYDLTVNDTKVTNENCANIPITSGTASYNPTTNTLTLNNAVIDCAARGEEYYPIISFLDGLTINFTGNCRITGSCVAGLSLWGTSTTLNVTGSTVIEANYASTGNTSDGYSFNGIVCDGDVTLTGGGQLLIITDLEGVSNYGTFTIIHTELQANSRMREAFTDGSLILKDNAYAAFRGNNGALVNSGLQLFGRLSILQPSGAHYDSSQQGIVDTNGDIIKNRWVVIAQDDTPTAIPTTPSVPSLSSESSVLHNLQGQRVNSSYKGIVIKDGKKVVNTAN